MFDLMKIGEVVVNVDADGRYCLNDLHKASGGNAKHAPALWLRASSTADLIEELINESESLCKIQNRILEKNQPLKVIYGGNLRGTYACRELVYAYAMWISPSFNLRVIRAFDNIQQVKQQTQGAVDLEDPEFLQGLLMKYAEDKKRLMQEKQQLESKVVVQDTVIAVQEEQLESLHNLFTEGMSPTKFARQLNGVNSNEMLKYLIDIGWIYRRDWESKKTGRTGTNWYSYGNVRGKYLRDISYTPYKGALPVYHVELLKEGAVKLYEMYLDGKLPMKKGWDGKFTHDVL